MSLASYQVQTAVIDIWLVLDKQKHHCKDLQRPCCNILKPAKFHQPMPTFLADRKFNWLVNRAQASLCSAIAFCHCHRDRRALTEACVHDPWQDPKTYTCTYRQGFTSWKYRTWELASWSWLKCGEKCELMAKLRGLFSCGDRWGVCNGHGAGHRLCHGAGHRLRHGPGGCRSHGVPRSGRRGHCHSCGIGILGRRYSVIITAAALQRQGGNVAQANNHESTCKLHGRNGWWCREVSKANVVQASFLEPNSRSTGAVSEKCALQSMIETWKCQDDHIWSTSPNPVLPVSAISATHLVNCNITYSENKQKSWT